MLLPALYHLTSVRRMMTTLAQDHRTACHR
jgi:hypothetical protein